MASGLYPIILLIGGMKDRYEIELIEKVDFAVTFQKPIFLWYVLLCCHMNIAWDSLVKISLGLKDKNRGNISLTNLSVHALAQQLFINQ